jgi:molybdate transport system substrate-binding protein
MNEQEAGPTDRVEQELIVFAAASLAEAFTDLGQAFEDSHPGVGVVFNFAGSQALRTQIEEGAIADVFASASPGELERLVATGDVAPDAGHGFARNRLIVILPQDNPAWIAALGDLARPGVKIVLAAEEVPAGRYARQALINLNAAWGPGYAEAVLANVVSNEENVKQVVAKVSLGEADAGIVYATDALAEPSLPTVSIDDSYNVIASYPLAVLVGAPRADLAEDFVGFVLSPEGQAILGSFGFLPRAPD